MEDRLLFSEQKAKKELEWNVKDLVKLALCWALTLTTSTLLTTIGPLAAKHTGASDTLAPFTIGTFLIGAAVSSVPSGPLFRKYGRYGGFAVGCGCQIIGSALGALAMIIDSQVFLYLGCFFVGLGQGLGQFYRFLISLLQPLTSSLPPSPPSLDSLLLISPHQNIKVKL
jgi:MFS family permease